MIVAFDIDGVLADTHAQVLSVYNFVHGDVLKPEDITEWNMDKFAKPGVRFDEFFNNEELYNYVDPYTGALGAVNAVRAAGHRVVFATACAPRTRGKKYEWLVRNGFTWDRPRPWLDYVEIADKSLLAANVLIDDGIHNFENFSGVGILWGRSWNQSYTGPCKRIDNQPEDRWDLLLDTLGVSHAA